MSKVFTISEGLENLGALKTGGQGSIYRGKRIGPIITAVKLLPTPITSEDPNDKHYRDFRNEVEKLKRVNEMPNANVVRILNFGISETGSFPFIEMEFIEGPDLEELLKAPHDPVFTIKETIRVAEHLANALAHCHRAEVRHGDIKSNNIKFNVHTGNYVLLDFGLAVMSDEQRRTSLRNAGAIEFMAPEQSEGEMLYQTDVYSYGIILYELLAGRVPFPLESKHETARNHVLVAHRETPPPDLLPLREEHMPSTWPQDRQHHEMQVPQWLLDTIRKCLDKDPNKRFANGMELYDHILRSSTAVAQSDDLTAMLRKENQSLKEQVARLQAQLKEAPAPPPVFAQARASAPPPPAYAAQPATARRGNSLVLPIVAACVALGVLGFLFLKNNNSSEADTLTSDSSTVSYQNTAPVAAQGSSEGLQLPRDTVVVREEIPLTTPADQLPPEEQPNDREPEPDRTEEPSTTTPEEPTPPAPRVAGRHYVVNSARAYFHNQPEQSSRREAYLTPSDEVMTATDEKGDYVYIVFTNENGQTSKGWVRKSDLTPVE